MVSVTHSGTATTWESYRLECFVAVTGSIDTPTITWMNDGVEILSSDPARNVSETTDCAGCYSSTLIFSPLRASDAGIFVHRATL